MYDEHKSLARVGVTTRQRANPDTTTRTTTIRSDDLTGSGFDSIGSIGTIGRLAATADDDDYDDVTLDALDGQVDPLNEVDDTPAPKPMVLDDDQDADDLEVDVNAGFYDEQQPQLQRQQSQQKDTPSHAPLLDQESSEDEDNNGELLDEEVNNDPHCYCRLPWNGDEPMVECQNCQIWYHLDCCGLPLNKVFKADETFQCDDCLKKQGLPPNNFGKRRDRRKEFEKANEKKERRDRARAAKKAGVSKAERAAIRNKERLARRKEREAERSKQEKQQAVGGLKSLIQAFDDESSDSSDSSDDDSSEDEAPKTASQQVTPKGAANSKASPHKPSAVSSSTLKKTATGPSSGGLMSKNMSGLYEPVRAKVRSTLTPLLNATLASEVELALFQHHHNTAGKAYLAQCRDIMANLKDAKNDLRTRVLSSKITPTQLASLSSNELASSEMSEMREKIRKEAVKNSVRAISPPRDSLRINQNKSAAADDANTSVGDAFLQSAIAATRIEIPTTPRTQNSSINKGLLSPASNLSTPTGRSGPSTLLADLPQLGSYEEVIKSYQVAEEKRKANVAAAAAKEDASSSPARGDSSPSSTKDRMEAARRAKRREIVRTANAALVEGNKRAKNQPIHLLDDESAAVSPFPNSDPDAPPKTEMVEKAVGGGGKQEEELLYQQLNLPPMDVWNGDLLLSAGANPSVLTNYFPLIARQFGGPPVVTLPLPSRIEESLRLKIDEVQKYLQQVVARGSKKVVLVEFVLNTHSNSSAVLQEDYNAFCSNYYKKNRALAFDYQKDPDVSNRLLLYIIPPDTTTHLTAEFVKKYLKVQRPQGKMWGIFILPKETYSSIAKRISKVNLVKMQQQAAAMEKYQKEMNGSGGMNATQSSDANVHASVTPAARPADPRRKAEPATSSASEHVVKIEPPIKTDPSASASAAPPTASISSPAKAAGTTDFASLLTSNPSQMDLFNSLLTKLVNKTGVAASSTAPTVVPAPAVKPPPPAFQPPAAFPAASSFPLPPPPAAATAPFVPPPAPRTTFIPPPAPTQNQFAPPPAAPMHYPPPPPPQHHMLPPPPHFAPPPAPHSMPVPPPPAQHHLSAAPVSPVHPSSVLGKHARDNLGTASVPLTQQPAHRKSRFGPDKGSSVAVAMPLPPPPPPQPQHHLPPPPQNFPVNHGMPHAPPQFSPQHARAPMPPPPQQQHGMPPPPPPPQPHHLHQQPQQYGALSPHHPQQQPPQHYPPPPQTRHQQPQFR